MKEKTKQNIKDIAMVVAAMAAGGLLTYWVNFCWRKPVPQQDNFKKATEQVDSLRSNTSVKTR